MERMPISQCHHDSSAAGKDLPADLQQHACSWYFTKDEIDNHSPSRKDGIDRMRESSLRKSYCLFLTDLGIKLRVSPVTTATAMMYCHRFYMRQSHAKNDWQTIATACIFLACKVEDNLRPLRDVTIVAYERIYNWDPSASQRIRQREVYHKHKELILDAEHLLLVTIAFDISIKLPFMPLVDALKRLKISNNDVAKAAWNLVNEWLRTTLCLQYKPQYIAAGSLSVAAKLLNVKLPMSDGNAWWLQFDVSPKQLKEVTQQMLRYFKHDEKQKVQQVPGIEKKSNLEAKESASQNMESCLVSGLTVGSHREEVASANDRLGEPASFRSGLCNSTKGKHHILKDASGYQSSDCCSGMSGVVDSETVHKSSKTAHVNDALSNIDVGRLKGAFERTRHAKCVKRKDVELAASESDSEICIERELEKGVELEYPAATKKQKVFED